MIPLLVFLYLGLSQSLGQQVRDGPSNYYSLSHYPELTEEQKSQIIAQEEFRRAIIEANRQKPFRPSQPIPVDFTTEEPRRISRPPVTTPIPQIKNQRINNTQDDIVVDEEVAQEQADNVHYNFLASVHDTINDNTQIREEHRDGPVLTGYYSYSDGYFKNTVNYIADENGYRVISKESEPIGDGPQINPDGKIDVDSRVDGFSLQYTVDGAQLQNRRRQEHITSTPVRNSQFLPQ